MYKILCVILSVMFFASHNTQFCFAQAVPEISAPSAILMDYTTGEILYEKNPDEKRPLASVTKIMTMLLAMEEVDKGNLKFDDVIVGSEHAKSYGGSTIFLDAGECMSVSDIMKGIAVASGNDASVAMAEHISGSEAAFVDLMNKRASELKMTNTHFVNACGLDADGHYSSARDIALMSRELMKHEEIFAYTSIWMDSLRNGAFTLSNTNKLIKFYEGATGLKTGSTNNAGFCISATAKRDNMHLIAVIMGAETTKNRQADASVLMNYGFSSYKIHNTANANAIIGSVSVQKGVKDKVSVNTAENRDYLIESSSGDKIETKMQLSSSLKAPVKKNDYAGKLIIYKNEKVVDEISIVCSEECKKRSFGDFFRDVCTLWLFG